MEKLLIAFIILGCLLSPSNAVMQTSDDACESDFFTIGDNTNIDNRPTTSLTNFTNLCIPLLEDQNNGIKSTICVYDGVFTLDAVQNANDSDVEVLAQDYCGNLQKQVNDKIEMILDLHNLDYYDDTFGEECEEILLSVTNFWFDPVIPSEMIEVQDMCLAYQELFIGLDLNSNATGVYYDSDDIIIYSYTMNYYMYINAEEEQLYEKCVDSKIVEDSAEYCNETLMPTVSVCLWTDDSIESVCEDMEEFLEENCSEEDLENLDCYPCAYGISYIFAKYEDYVITALEVSLDDVTQQQVDAIEEAKDLAQDEDEEDLNEIDQSSETIPIEYPY